MVAFLIRWCVTAVAVLVAAQVVNGVHYEGYAALAVTALVLGILNAFLRPLLLVITLPFNILSFGILTLFINALLFWWAGNLVKGFHVDRFFWSAFLGALIVSIVSFVLNSLLGKGGREKMYRPQSQPPPGRDDNVIDV